MAEIVVGMDPSSKATAVAVLCDGALETYIIIHPKRSLSPVMRAEQVYQECVDFLARVVSKLGPIDSAVVEFSNGQAHESLRQKTGGATVGMATYGMSVFAAARAALHLGIPVVDIHTNEWTCRVPKKNRQLGVIARHPGYVADDDPGMDAADAIGVAEYFVKRRRLNGGVYLPNRRKRTVSRGTGDSSRRRSAHAGKKPRAQAERV